ncbi:MAG TPA: Smr/MutS family protein [Candidatus Acidoferrales bacterium]|nr:Smr/MutS family protein [Candidatus Acidoferrales bacterium]
MGEGRARQQIAQESAAALVHRPFGILNQVASGRSAVKRAAAPSPATPPLPPAHPEPVDEDTLFLNAVAGVTPLAPRSRERVASPAPAVPPRPIADPDAEALAELCDLVSGQAPFDITNGDDYIEGGAVGIDPRLVRRLRAGEFAYQAHLDLHGMTSDEARHAVETFLTRAYQDGKRCVLIIHGRGRNSKDQIPVLKSRLTVWLARGQWARWILAFTSARACDGGAGALYVLLRRQRHARRPIRVTAGAKW